MPHATTRPLFHNAHQLALFTLVGVGVSGTSMACRYDYEKVTVLNATGASAANSAGAIQVGTGGYGIGTDGGRSGLGGTPSTDSDDNEGGVAGSDDWSIGSGSPNNAGGSQFGSGGIGGTGSMNGDAGGDGWITAGGATGVNVIGAGGSPEGSGRSGSAGATTTIETDGGSGGTSSGWITAGGTTDVSVIGAGGTGNGTDAGASGAGGSTAGTGGVSQSTICRTDIFGSHYYEMCDIALSYASAKADCESRGLKLVRIDDAAEDAWLHSTIPAADQASNNTAVWRWLGGDDLVVTGDWNWTDGTPFWTGGSKGTAVGDAYTNWAKNQPINPHCLAMQASKGYWYAMDCTAARPYLCEQY